MRSYTRPPATAGGVLSRRRLLAGTAAATLLGAAGCSRPDNAATLATTGGRVTKVSYLTSFGRFGRDCFVDVAQELGFFAEAGLQVTVNAGSGTADLVTKMLADQAQFCSMDLTGLLLVYRKPDAATLTAVAAIHQRSLAGIMTLTGRRITSPRDLEGRTVGDPTGSVNSLLFPAYARLSGVDARKVRFINLPADQLPANLASGTVDAIGQFVVGKPLIEKAAAGRQAVVLPYSDYMADLTGNMLVTRRSLVHDDPGLVTRFRDALLKGLTYAIGNPAEAGRILARHQPTQNSEVAAKELELMAAYVRPGRPGQPVGTVEPIRIMKSIALLQGSGAIPPGLTPEQVVSFDLTPPPKATA